jgi:hypothetical protein
MEEIIQKLNEALNGTQEEFKKMKGSTGNIDWEEGYMEGWKDAVETITELLANKK